MKKIKKETVKQIGGTIVAFTVGGLVTNLVENNTNTEDMGTLKKLGLSIGGLVIASMVAKKAVDYFDETVDEMTLPKGNVDEPENK